MVFRKWPISLVALDNTLDKSLFPGKNHPLNILQPSFPHRGHTFSVGYAHPAVGPGAPSSSPPFRNKLPSHKTLFQKLFRETRFSLLGKQLWLPLSYKPLHAAADCQLVWILLGTRHTHSGSSLFGDLWSGKRDLGRHRCSSRVSRFIQSAKANFLRKSDLHH